MAMISLRAYLREIEEMIDNGHYDDALIHCRHILEHFPKHVEAYRLMGKALLESHRLADASDIFQRVLACIPDDFISHLGMSIIREDEGDLDDAIWHMERAFEVHPSNAAVQAELRRLYGKRDGLAPQKIQLTRGAMARMSAKSALYSQAIAELRTAMAEDPERLDLQVALAEIYAQSSDQLAAIDTCNLILNKLPYCYSANFLLVQLLPGTDRSGETHIYRERLEEIDPYCTHLSENYKSPDQVPETLVTIDRYEGRTVEENILSEPEPGWIPSLDEEEINLESSTEELPEWLREFPNQTIGEEPEPEEPKIDEQSPFAELADAKKNNNQDEDEIPQWLKDIGWEAPFQKEWESDETVNSFESATDYFEEAPDSGEDYSPESLKSVTPEITEVSPETEVPISQSESSHEIEIPHDEAEHGLPEKLTPAESLEATGGEEDIPDWLQDLGEGLPEVPAPQKELEATELQPEQRSQSKEGNQVEEYFPDEPLAKLPEWLEKVVPESSDQEEEFEIARAEIPTWLRQLEEQLMLDLTEQEEEKPLVDSIEFESGDQPLGSEEIPDWLAAAMLADTRDFLPEDKPEKILTPEVIDVSDTQPVQVESLQELSAAEQPEAETQMGAESIGPSLLQGEELAEQGSPLAQEFNALSEEDEEAALAWLENLAARQGAIEEELLTPPEERLAEMPGWIREEATEAPEMSSREGEEEPEELTIELESATSDEVRSVVTAEDITEEISAESQAPFIWEPELEEAQAFPGEAQEKISTEELEGITAATPFVEEMPEEIIIKETVQPKEELPAWLRDIEIETEPPNWVPPEEAAPVKEPERAEGVVQKIDINAASLGQLERIPGVGFILAQTIINYRDSTGGFKSLAELINVPGLTASTISDLEKYLTVEIITEMVEPVTVIPELKQAWDMLVGGDVEAAVERYSDLIRRQEHLDDVIRELQEAVSMYLSNAALYQTLGDAYVRANRLQDALTAYTRAEDLLA